MAGFAAYMKVDGFNILPIMSFSMAATTFVGQNYGAGKTDRVKEEHVVTLGMGVGYTVLTGVLRWPSRTPSCSCSPMMWRSWPLAAPRCTTSAPSTGN